MKYLVTFNLKKNNILKDIVTVLIDKIHVFKTNKHHFKNMYVFCYAHLYNKYKNLIISDIK